LPTLVASRHSGNAIVLPVLFSKSGHCRVGRLCLHPPGHLMADCRIKNNRNAREYLAALREAGRRGPCNRCSTYRRAPVGTGRGDRRRCPALALACSGAVRHERVGISRTRRRPPRPALPSSPGRTGGAVPVEKEAPPHRPGRPVGGEQPPCRPRRWRRFPLAVQHARQCPFMRGQKQSSWLPRHSRTD
jgi:hypothetical protein